MRYHTNRGTSMKILSERLQEYKALDVEQRLAYAVSDIGESDSLSNLKEKLSPEAFTAYIAVHMIGNWKSDGWSYLLYEGREFLPYIQNTLEELGLQKLKEAFDHALSIYPSFTKNSDDKAFTDITNFLINPRFKISDERLLAFSKEERAQMSNAYHDALENLDRLSESLWGYGTDGDGFQSVLDYIKKHSENEKNRGS